MEEIVLQHTVGLFQDGLSVFLQDRVSIGVEGGLGHPFLAPADLHDGLLHRADQRLVLAAFAPKDLLFHHRHIDHMEVVVIHFLAQCLGHSPVDLVGVHHGGEDILLPAHDLHGGFVGVGVKLPGKFIAAVVVEVGGVHIKNQLAKVDGVWFQTAGGDDFVLFHLPEHLRVAGGGGFEVDIERGAFRENIGVAVAVFFPFVVFLGVADVLVRDIHISGAGTVDSVVSCHKINSFRWGVDGRGTGDALPAGSVITHYNTFIPKGCKVPWALRGGLRALRCPPLDIENLPHRFSISSPKSCVPTSGRNSLASAITRKIFADCPSQTARCLR